MNTEPQPKFALGRLVATPNALESIPAEDWHAALGRHAACDWGECGPENWQENELSLKEGFRLFSVYHDRNGVKFWVITKADRSVTTDASARGLLETSGPGVWPGSPKNQDSK